MRILVDCSQIEWAWFFKSQNKMLFKDTCDPSKKWNKLTFTCLGINPLHLHSLFLQEIQISEAKSICS